MKWNGIRVDGEARGTSWEKRKRSIIFKCRYEHLTKLESRGSSNIYVVVGTDNYQEHGTPEYIITQIASEYVIWKLRSRALSGRDWPFVMVSVAVQTDPCEFALSELRSVPLGRPWSGEDEDTSHIQHGYYRRYDGTLGKVKNGVKLTDSEDDHSSSQSAKRARYDPDDVSSQESMLQKCDVCGHEWNDGSQCEHSILKPVHQAVDPSGDDQTTDDEGEVVPQYNRCNNTFMKDGQEIECEGETNGSSQLCHRCLQCVKRSFFAY